MLKKKNRKKLIFIFLDGVGIGDNNPDWNPFFSRRNDFFYMFKNNIPSKTKPFYISKHISFIPIDAVMDVKGLPQSGTGQVSLFCGINASLILNQHFGPYPHSELIPVLNTKNVLYDLKKNKLKVYFLNSYPKQFFDYINAGKRKLSATTLSCLNSRIDLNGYEFLKRKKSISAEINNYFWINKFDYNLTTEEPFNVGKRVANLVSEFDFILFEYFLTDYAGHSRNMSYAEYTLNVISKFINGIFENIRENTLVFITSDHGNIEDLSVKTHTFNNVPGIAFGKNHDEFLKNINSLKDVKNKILNYFEI